jgi:HicA toxin of bacterial toxin-antitoxin,
MSKDQKALDRLLSKPSDYEWRELERLMASFGYELRTGSGSSRKFIHRKTKVTFMTHEPHPAKVLKQYQLKDVITFMKVEKYIK